jgi:hypothetical protein
MCCGNVPRLCECGCSEYDHEEMLSWGVEALGFPTDTRTSRGKCNGEKLGAIIQGMPEFTPCQCQKFKDAFEPEYTCRMP